MILDIVIVIICSMAIVRAVGRIGSALSKKKSDD